MTSGYQPSFLKEIRPTLSPTMASDISAREMGVPLSVAKELLTVVGLFGLFCPASSAAVWANGGCRVASQAELASV